MSIELSEAEPFLSWLKTKATLNAVEPKAKLRFVKRGQVYWCHFGINVGSEISKATPRPAVIVQNYIANRNSANTIVVPITHNTKTMPCLVPITPITDNTGKLILDGQANTANIICVSKARLGDLITTLAPSQMKEIDKSIASSLELMKYYDQETEKEEKLSNYMAKLKSERNDAQDKISEIKKLLADLDFNEEKLQSLKILLDMEY